MKYILKGKVYQGKLQMSDDFDTQVALLEGQEVSVTIEKYRNKRSINQNNYYWGVVVKLISEETGYSLHETHDILRGKFLGKTKKIGTETIHYSRSSASLNTKEMEQYLSDIREWASIILNCYVPEPNEVEA